MNSIACSNSYWTGLAQCYASLGPPLRPSRADILLFQEIVGQVRVPESGPFKALLLGVTPDVVGMQWPDGCSLMAVDGSWPMVQALWPGDLPGRHAVCADWLALPVPSKSVDVVAGDGSMCCLGYPNGFRRLASGLHALLKPNGTLVLRCYLQAPEPEQPEDVFEDLGRGTIPSFHHFKLRLLMAMQRSVQLGVAVSDVYERWHQQQVDRSSLPDCPGWEDAAIDMIEHYRDTDTVYCFPTRAELQDVFLDCFEEVSFTAHADDPGERCPFVVLRAR